MTSVLLRVGALSLGVCAASVLPQAHAAGAQITWGTPSQVTSGIDVLINGSYFGAYTASNIDLTVNGVVFSANGTSPVISAVSQGSLVLGTFASADANYNTLINSGIFTARDGLPDAVTLSGLTVANTYQVQVFMPAWDATWPTQLVSGSNEVSMGNAINTPTYVVGTFVASAPTLTFFYKSESTNFGLLSAVSVRDLTAVPEPSAFAWCAGAAGLALAALRRRRRA